jgi:ribosome-interacting GTPase 1
MPANVTMEYVKAEEKYEKARSNPEKVAALKEMLSTIPKHKGTEMMRRNLTQRLARLKREEADRKRKAAKRHSLAVPKEGFQIAIIGFPNSGKSTLLGKLTNAHPKIAGYPFTTKKPEVGTLKHGGARLQLVEIPALVKGAATKQGELMGLVATADAIILIYDNEKERDTLRNELKAFRITKPVLEMQKHDQINAKQIFGHFSLIRVYTKEPGGKPEQDNPIVLKHGSTVMQAAREVHKDFATKFNFARVWGSSRFAGQRVEKDHTLKDGDIVEFHTK